MTRGERLEAKVQARHEWADKREERTAATSKIGKMNSNPGDAAYWFESATELTRTRASRLVFGGESTSGILDFTRVPKRGSEWKGPRGIAEVMSIGFQGGVVYFVTYKYAGARNKSTVTIEKFFKRFLPLPGDNA